MRARTLSALSVLDYHTEGEPMRIVVDGAPALDGATMLERSNAFAARHDGLRRMMLDEPRGHAAMCGALLAPPSNPAADMGVIFVEPLGVVHMCGHGAIAIATMLVEHGRVPVRSPETVVRLDTAAGLVTARVRVDGERIGPATIRNVASYSVMLDAKADVDGFGPVAFDLAYGGHFYALVDAASVGLVLRQEHAARIVDAGERIRTALERSVPLVHPEGGQSKGLLYVQFHGPPRDPRANLVNAVVVAPAALDRSPCGTGTSARLANLWARRRLGIGQPFVHESIIGTLFEGRIVDLTTVGPYEAIVPEITGHAYQIAESRLMVADGDPFPSGFRL